MKMKIVVSAIILIAISLFANLKSFSSVDNSDQNNEMKAGNHVVIRAIHGGVPAEGTVVTLSNSDYFVKGTTDHIGYITFNNVPAGVYNIFGRQYSPVSYTHLRAHETL